MGCHFGAQVVSGSTNGFMLCSDCDFGILTATIGQQISSTSEIIIIDLQLNITD
jgi:hypothetical protein